MSVLRNQAWVTLRSTDSYWDCISILKTQLEPSRDSSLLQNKSLCFRKTQARYTKPNYRKLSCYSVNSAALTEYHRLGDLITTQISHGFWRLGSSGQGAKGRVFLRPLFLDRLLENGRRFLPPLVFIRILRPLWGSTLMTQT